MEAYRRFPADMRATLLQLNIADDYFKAKAQIERLEQDIELKDKELYNLIHDLIQSQIKAENSDKTVKELEAENKELLLEKTRLETSLKEMKSKKNKAASKEEEITEV